MSVIYYVQSIRMENLLTNLITTKKLKKITGNIAKILSRKKMLSRLLSTKLPATNISAIFLEKKKTNRTFEFPSWMKKLNDPSEQFNLETPTYKEIQKIISKMKSSGSPCPFDHISVIVLKNCSILRTQVWRICKYCWENKIFPEIWKNSTTILIHKKGSPNDPSNFRPITLEPILSKILTSLIRN